MNRLRLLAGLAVSGLVLASNCAGAAERFGDIMVSPQSLMVGETYHGYREYRILLDNQSLKDTHEVSLVFPDRAFPSGNTISRLSRTVSVAPMSRVAVSFWQPPLRQEGDGRLII